MPNLLKSIDEYADTLFSDTNNVQLSIVGTNLSPLNGLTTGIILIDADTASAEYIGFNSISGNTYQVPIANRGLCGTSASAHLKGASIQIVVCSPYQNGILTVLNSIANDAGGLKNFLSIPSPLMGGAIDGWINGLEVFTSFNASTNALVINNDVSTKYQIGDKIKLVDSGATKYYTLTSVVVTNPLGTVITTLTLNGLGISTAISSIPTSFFYSRFKQPFGFPPFDRYRFSAYETFSHTLTATTTKILFDTIIFDDMNIFNAGTSTFTAPISGFYQVNAQIAVTPQAGNGSAYLEYWKNGAGFLRGGRSTSTDYISISTSAFIKLNQSDTLDVRCTLSNGRLTDGVSNYFQGFLVSL